MHGRRRQLITLIIAVLLVTALVVGIREVAANREEVAGGPQNAAVLSSEGAASKGVTMGQSESTSSAGQSATSQSVTTNVTSTTDGNGQTSTSVTVNGKPIAVPNNGELHKTMTDENGTTQLDISNGSSSSSSSTSVNVQVNGSSTSSSE
jgi:hypothetical protein